MANNYEQIMALVNAGNKMGLSNAITRDNGIPLDLSSVYNTYEDAVVYAATKAIAYQNQVIAAEGVVYVIVAESQGKVKIGEVEYDNYLKPVGTAPTGDNASITVTAEGLVSVFGFAGAQDGMLPVRENGVLTWKTLEAIGAGDGNDNTTYQFALNAGGNGIVVTPLFNGQPMHDGEGEDAPQIKYEVVLDVYTKGEADEKFLSKADYTPYDDTALANRVKALEDEERYDETPLANRVTAIENTIGDAEGGLVKDIADNTAAIGVNAAAITTEKERAIAAEAKVLEDAEAFTVDQIEGLSIAIEKIEGVDNLVIKNGEGKTVANVDATPFIKDGMLESAEYNVETKKLVLTWNTAAGITSTEIDLNGLVDTYTGGTGITVGTDGVISVDDTIATVEALNGVKATAEAAQTADQVAQAIATAIADYAKTADVNAALGLKADKTDLDNYYTKDEVDGKGYAVATEVAETYATKEEFEAHTADAANTYAVKADVEAALDKKIEKGTIAHSTEEVAEGVTVDGTNLNIVVDAFTKAETRQYVADTIKTMTGGESAADVKLLLENHIADYEEKVGQIDTKNGEQDTAIAAAQTQADKGVADAKAAADAVEALANGQVATNKGDLDAVKGRLTTLETAKGDHDGRIIALEGKATSLEGAIGTINQSIGALQGKDVELVAEDARLAGLIDGLTTGKANAADVYTKGEVDTKVQEAIDAIPEVDFGPYAKTEDVNAALALKADADKVYTKDEADAAFMTQEEVDDRLNALINAADPEGGKVISDIQNLVKYVEENAGEIAALVTATDANTAKLAGIETTVTDYLANALAAIVQPKASTEVTVAADGTLGIGEVNVNKLVQSEGDTFIIDGGKA